MIRNSTFYGTAETTHYVDEEGRAWLIQSPDMPRGSLAISAENPEGDELRVDDEDLQVLAMRLDQLPRSGGGAITARDFAHHGIE